MRPVVTLGALARVALVTGTVAFGGGFAAIARLKQVMVDERRWLGEEEFTERVGVAGALPGTIVTNLLVLVGHLLRGVAGALVASLVFVLPGCAMITVLAMLYDGVLQGTRAVRGALDGMNPAVAGLFAAIAIDLGKGSLRSLRGWLVAGATVVALTLRWLTLLEVIAIAGLVGAVGARPKPPAAAALVVPAIALGFAPPAWLALLGVFARIGVATFGGGVAMVPAIEHESIARGWLDERTFADAVAFGQITPGPVAITATFVGFRVAGPLGALTSTVGVLAPPVVLALLAARSLAAFRENRAVQGFLRGVSPAVCGVIAAAAISVGRASVHGVIDGAILAGCLAARVLLPRTSPLWPLAAGALAGIARAYVMR